jgi:hypothetical protein
MAEPSELRNLLAETVTASETAAEPVQSGKPEAATDTPEKPETPSGERPRGPDGKFLPKDAEQPEETEEEPSETETEPEEGEADLEAPAITEPKVDVPAHWSQADKDLVAKLPAEHRQAVVDRYKAIEAGFTPKLMRAAELEKQFGAAEEVFKPYAEVLRQRNQTASDVVKAWASVERGFQEGLQDAQMGRPNDKGATLVARMIQQYRVDPVAVATILQGQVWQTNEAAAPPAPAIPQELLQKINSLEEWKTNTERATQTERLSTAERQIGTFAQEKDAAGNLAHPYFSELEQDMMALARLDQAQGKTIDLADLYDRAAYANRETRAKLLAASEAQAKQKAAADRKAKAAQAQRASSSVTGSPGSGQSPNDIRGRAKSLREELEANTAEYDAA